ncbi:MAG: DUF4118 domain-containing protein [Planctomycetaceae bacterium]
MLSERPNPEDLLAHVQAEERQSRRGSLKIFFGYAAGVGKTYAMLETARHEKEVGRDVVVGYVEPHGRRETESLLEGLEILPFRQFDYRGVTLREFDVDAALKRRPDLIVVDELAHTNAEGSRHSKRWQDVEELLDAGINVWTTLNVQHIESLNDVIGQITGITVRETVPDLIFDSTEDLELIDITPAELLTRLSEGKVYLPEQAARAIQSFFQKVNLTALRELSFRHAARRMHSDVETARRRKSVTEPWATADRIIVCVGPSPTTSRVIRTAKRMAAALDAPWIAVSVEKSGAVRSERVGEQIARHFRLAERLGAETATLAGEDVASTLLEYARSRNTTKIFIGKSHHPYWKRLLFRSVVDQLLELSGDIDVYVIHGRNENDVPIPAAPHAISKKNYTEYLKSGIIIAFAGCVAWWFSRLHLADTNVVMIFLAAVTLIAYRYGRGPAIAASIASVLLFDFFFVLPYLTFAIEDTQYIITFAVMLAIGLVISTLTSRLKGQIDSGQLRERRTSALFQLGKQLSSLSGEAFLTSAAGQQIAELCGGEVAIYLNRHQAIPQLVFGEKTSIAQHPISPLAAQWVIEHDQIAGAKTDTLPNAVGVFIPLAASQQTLGAIAVRTEPVERSLEPDRRQLLEACANQLALALERDQMAIEATEARIQAETEQIRSSLLSSVSHDLKTPLAAIAGASSSLLQSQEIDHDTSRMLLQTIFEETQRLNRLLENILQMSKLDSGAASANKQWHVLEEIVGTALYRIRSDLERYLINVNLPADLPLIFVDGVLLEQLFVNLLENAVRYTPVGTTIAITAAVHGKWLEIVVEDNGPGLKPGSENLIFEKFYRASPTVDSGQGSGLGLAICRAIATVHGGKITAANRPEGGARFILLLPSSPNVPQILVE